MTGTLCAFSRGHWSLTPWLETGRISQPVPVPRRFRVLSVSGGCRFAEWSLAIISRHVFSAPWRCRLRSSYTVFLKASVVIPGTKGKRFLLINHFAILIVVQPVTSRTVL